MTTGFANDSFLVARGIDQLSEFKPFDNPSEFPVEVNGRHLIARLTGRINNPVQWQLIVEFSDGVTDMFYPQSEFSDEWFVANKKNFAYAKGVSSALNKHFNKHFATL